MGVDPNWGILPQGGTQNALATGLQLGGQIRQNEQQNALLEMKQREFASQQQRDKSQQQAEQTKQLAGIIKRVKADPSKYPLARQAAINLGIPADKIPEQYDPQWVDQQDYTFQVLSDPEKLTGIAQEVQLATGFAPGSQEFQQALQQRILQEGQFTIGNRRYDPTGKMVAEAPYAPHYGTVSEGQSIYRDQPGVNGPIGGYDTVLGNGQYGQPPMPLTQMPIGQAIEFGKNVLIPNSKAAGVGRDSRGLIGSSAMGAYQITQSTLQEFAPQVLGPDWMNQPFSPEVQDRIGEAIFNSTGRDPAKLQARWASLNPQEAAAVARMPWDQAKRVIAEGESGGGTQIIAQGAPKANASGGTPTGLIEKGYRLKPDGTMEPIPGGPADPGSVELPAPREMAKRNAAYPKVSSAYRTSTQKIDQQIADITTLLNHPGLNGIVGLFDANTPNILPSSRAAKALYDKIMARGQFNELQDMRNSSPTGGALGAVSDSENKTLRDAAAALARNQDESDFKLRAQEYLNTLRASKTNIQQAFDDTYSYRNQQPQSAPRAAPKPSVSNW